ncbi:MAG TPA: peptide ABC transporter substrate-binding protein [Candidatus Omnitrophica bacterium]|nr:peptide ABC transporter substrate-binding protein [Candidatus Omnitrophota bacterium]
MNSQVFEGLLDLDENLNLRGRLASSWEIYEEAYIETDEPFSLKGKIESKIGEYEFLEDIKSIEVIKKGLKITLSEVKPDFFIKLKEAFPEIPIKKTVHNPVILFHLRKGVRWHDGEPFTAKDVKFTYQAIMEISNRSPRTSDFEPVKSVEIVDDYTVKVTYKRLFSPAIYSWMIGIIPEHLLNKDKLKEEARRKGKDVSGFTIRDSGFNRNPIGIGPFKFKEWKSDQYIRLIRNDDYWEGPPNYHEYIYRVIPDMLTQEMDFYAGAIDSYGARAHQVARLKKDERFQHFSGLSYGYTYIGYNMRRELFKDKRVRQALTMAINIPEIIEYVLYGEAEVTTGPFVKQSEYYNREVEPLPYAPEKSLQILKELGWRKNKDGWLEKDGKLFQFNLITNAGNPYRKAIMTIAQNSWKRLGIKVSADTVEWSVFLEKHIDKGNFDAVVLGWSMGIDPDLYQIWHSSQSGPYQLNFVAYSNPLADELIIKIREEYNIERQIEYCHKLHRIIYQDQPYTFLYVGKWTALLDKKIVILERVDGREVIKKIRATKTGDYTYFFNKWIKLEEPPVFEAEM